MGRKSSIDRAREFGAVAARDGLSEQDCPYHDLRTHRGAVTWSRAYMRAWLAGFREARGASERPEKGPSENG